MQAHYRRLQVNCQSFVEGEAYLPTVACYSDSGSGSVCNDGQGLTAQALGSSQAHAEQGRHDAPPACRYRAARSLLPNYMQLHARWIITTGPKCQDT